MRNIVEKYDTPKTFHLSFQLKSLSSSQLQKLKQRKIMAHEKRTFSSILGKPHFFSGPAAKALPPPLELSGQIFFELQKKYFSLVARPLPLIEVTFNLICELSFSCICVHGYGYDSQTNTDSDPNTFKALYKAK